MTTLERIRELCKQNDISVSKLERILGFSNGSIPKAKEIKSDRLKQIADYFGVSMEFLLTGDDPVKKTNEEINVSYDNIMQNMNNGIYLDADVLALSQQLKDSPERRKLFKLSSQVSPHDIELVCKILERFTE